MSSDKPLAWAEKDEGQIRIYIIWFHIQMKHKDKERSTADSIWFHILYNSVTTQLQFKFDCLYDWSV